MKHKTWFLVLVLGTCLAGARALAKEQTTQKEPAQSEASTLPELPVIQYQLDNGLTVMLSPDSSRPIVAAELVYLVGSGHEREGRTGFAHLFEHLMFQGSKHYDEEYFKPYDPIGADVNGSTSRDRTNYYEQVPSHYAELPLWMESDRMRSLLPALDQEKLDNQRKVVKNERRQRYEITPYGMDFWYLSEALYPPGHPYRHTPIGTHEDLSAATLKDVKDFFRQYYVPRNAGLALVGDFQEQEMRQLVEKYFADIPGGRRAATPRAKRPVLKEPKHWVAQDEVQLPRVYLAWHTPALFEKGDAALDLLSNVLSTGKTSRLFHRLVYEEKVAKDVAAFQISQKLSGIFVVQATAAPGTTISELYGKLEAALEDALDEAPSKTEMERARNEYKKGFFGRLETYSARASLIGSYFLFTGKGDYLEEDYRRYLKPSASDVLAAGQRFFRRDRMVRLDFVPGKKGQLKKLEDPRIDVPAAQGASAPGDGKEGASVPNKAGGKK